MAATLQNFAPDVLDGFLQQELQKELLRFTTAGSVDDGKSTLIGRLLHDCKAVYEDQLASVKRSPVNRSGKEIDFSLLTDGLRAEREQGITIDVAYRYFSTARRKFIIADTPGHEQYTRNMATGASTADLAIILLDATKGVLAQTRRHAYIASLLGIPHLVAAINKMDLVAYDEQVFARLRDDFLTLAGGLGATSVECIPISALEGDNVVERGANTPWYSGPTLLEHLETVPLRLDTPSEAVRFPVQYVIRPQQDALHDYRGYAGRIVSGIFKKGDAVEVLPAGISSLIKEIEVSEKQIDEAFAPQSVIIHLEDDIDISRGDLIAKKDDSLSVTQDLEATVCWMNERPLNAGAKLLIRHHGKTVKASVRDVLYKLDVTSLNHIEGEKSVKLNEIARIQLRTASPIAIDSFLNNHSNGSFILVDENTNDTVGGCVV